MVDALSLTDLQKAAERSAAVYDWEAAQGLYTRALEMPDVPPEVEYELRNGRAMAGEYLHDLDAVRKDLAVIIQLTEALGDLPALIKALNRLAEKERIRGDLVTARHLVERSLSLARQIGNKKLEVESLRARFYILLRLQKIDQAEEVLSQALDMARETGDLEGEAHALRAQLSLAYETGRTEDRQHVSERAILLFRKLANRREEASLYHNLGVTEIDAARRRFYLEKGFDIANEINDLEVKPWILNGLGLLYWRLGLYGRARTHEEQVVQSMRQKGRQRELAFFLETLGRIYFDQGLFEEAEQAFTEGMQYVAGSGFEVALYRLGLGSLSLAREKLEAACAQLESASQEFEKAGAFGEQTIALARLGQAYLGLNNPKQALWATSRAVSIADGGNLSVEFHPQEVWWWHHRVLRAAQWADVDGVWQALDRAREVMLEGIATLGDEGLRRNYLNKVALNRDISTEWIGQAAARGLSLAPFLERETSPASLQEQFRRLVDTGNRLTGLRDPEALPQLILDEFVELSGAERAIVALQNEAATLTWAATLGIPEDEAAAVQALAAPILEQAQTYWQLIVRDVKGEPSPDGEAPLQRRAVVVVPLVSRGRLQGLLYGDMRHIFGRFTQTELDLLTLLANQAAAALENAYWSRSLEQKVEQRTADLEQRNAELTIINSISQALARQLDLQAIVDLIGDKIGEIFASDTTYIDLYDRQTNLIHCLYFVERGHRRELEPISLGKTLSSTVITTKQPLLLGTAQQAAAYTPFRISSPDTEQDLNESYLGVPILIGDDLVGAVVVQSYQQNAYGEAHVRLLTTLAANIGVALENARLFQETNRLLQESRQRTVELATVNTISQALISERDLDSLIELVGEQMRRTFEADVVYIALHDPQTGLIHFPYEFENGRRLTGQPMPYGQGMTSNIIESGQPLLINEDNLGRHVELGIEVVGTLAKSFLGVPITVGQQVIGVISVQSTQEEGRFDASDMALLSTIAANVGAAIQNAQLYRETQRRAEEMAALAEIGREISATLELDAVLERIAAYARQLLVGDDSAVFLREADGQSLRAIVALGDIAPQLKAFSIPLGQGIIGELALRGEAGIINDVPHDPRTLHIPGTQEGAEERLLAAPLLSREQVIGMMAVWRERGGDLFTQADIDFLVGLARQATIAITNARLFAEVQRQKRYFEALVENSPAAIVTLDLDGKGETWNPAAERLFGYTQEEALRQQVDDLVASVGAIHSEALDFSQRIAGGQPVRAITQRTRKNGTLVDVELFAEPVIVDGKQVGIIAIYHDITELLQARREAEAANQAKSVFLANMSHELRTPLNAIIGFTRIVRRKGAKTLPKRQVENLDKVLVSAEHLLGLISAVLDIAKIEAGRMDVHSSSFDPAALVGVCATTVQPMVRAGVRLVKQIEQDFPQACTDQDKVKQILFNLLSNAAKFTHEGHITVHARRQKETVVVGVSDTGIGIPRDALEWVFEEFQQADASTTRQYGGTGLGLAISRKLARLLGGDLVATSVEGVGSTFTLTIPLHYSGPRADDTASRSGFLGAQPPPMMRKPVLLAIDDDPDVIYLLRESLDEAGYLVVGATSGDEGVQKAKELRPFAITLDVLMPHRDGWQVLHELKAHPATQDIPVIMLTIVDKKALGYRLGAADYLVKPLDEEAVLDALRRLSPAKGPTPCGRLLVVDDDPQVVDMVRQLLDESLCEVEAVADGQAALEAVTRQRPDIILLDLMMSRLDGFGVIEQLRRDPAYRDIPVVVLSAKTLNAEERTLLEQSVSQVIRKQGLEAEVLIRELQKALAS